MESMSRRDEHDLWRWWEEHQAPTVDDLFVEEEGPGVIVAIVMSVMASMAFFLGVAVLLT